MTIDLSRQTELINPTPLRCLVIGAGAIGSTAVFTLMKMGFSHITLYDDDVLGPENIAGGVFDSRMIGKPKVKAVRSAITLLTGMTVTKIVDSLYTGQAEEADIVVVGADSLEKRKAIWDTLNVKDARLLIDGRIGGHNCSVFAVPLADESCVADYLKTFESEPEPLPCGMKTTFYIVERVAAGIGNAVRAFVNGDSLPFFQHWQAEDNMEITATA